MPPRTAGNAPFAVLFDLDGTLVDSIELIVNSARNAFKGYAGVAPTDAEWVNKLGMPLVDCFADYASSDEELAHLMNGYREYQRAHHDRLVRCYDSVVETVDRLRADGHPLGIVTSKSHELTRRALAIDGLQDHFDVIIALESTTKHKPNPEPVLAALEALGAAPERTVFVGDSPYDVNAGNAAGVISVGALWGPFSRESLERAGAQHFIAHIAEILPLLSNLSAVSGI